MLNLTEEQMKKKKKKKQKNLMKYFIYKENCLIGYVTTMLYFEIFICRTGNIIIHMKSDINCLFCFYFVLKANLATFQFLTVP